jgi:Protein of unknown function with PCYCGC motif
MRAARHLAAFFLVSSAILLALVSRGSGEMGQPQEGQVQRAKESSYSLPPIPKVKEPAEDIAVIQETYEFVGQHPEIAQYIPCFCACSKTKHHRSIEDCYIKSRGRNGVAVHWNKHAAECYICVSVAQEAQHSYRSGMNLPSIRSHIEQDLAPKFKYHTLTPAPPTKQ